MFNSDMTSKQARTELKYGIQMQIKVEFVKQFPYIFYDSFIVFIALLGLFFPVWGTPGRGRCAD